MIIMKKRKKTKGSTIGVFTPVYQTDHKNMATELKLANIELAFQKEEIGKRAAELIIANKELAFQNFKKGKRAAELIIANKELVFQNREKEKRAGELIIANKELELQNQEKEKRAAELIIANKELAFQNQEKEKRASELTLANIELKKAEESQKEYILGLEEMIFITSHKVRQPITQIQGISNLLEGNTNTQDEIEEIIGYLKDPIQSLDTFTRELTAYICKLQYKLKPNTEED